MRVTCGLHVADKWLAHGFHVASIALEVDRIDRIDRIAKRVRIDRIDWIDRKVG